MKMKWNEVFCHTFKAIREETGPETKRKVDLMLPSMPMVEACRAERFDFFQPFIDAGRLTEEQMRRACDRYHLGKTRSGQPIYWMIDDMMTPLDAHIGEGWISSLLPSMSGSSLTSTCTSTEPLRIMPPRRRRNSA